MITDPTLQAAAEAAYAVTFGESGFRVTDTLTAVELEQLLTAVRAAIAAPVLALHRPCHEGLSTTCNIGHGSGPGVAVPCCLACGGPWPCPTVRALGVTG